MADRVLVTGISGFIAAHIAHKLLDKGYLVRGTIRNRAKGEKIVHALASARADVERLELVTADLGADRHWAEVVKDCRYIQHIASPLPFQAPAEREALVSEARTGTQRVLEHGFSAGAERIVMTSSIAAMIGQAGKGAKMRISETDWSDPDWKHMGSYSVSKTRAELSAWAYVKAQGLRDRLSVIHPAIVLGPDSYGNGGASLALIQAIMTGRYSHVPKIAMPVVDVRDCASIHIAAMTGENAAGRRLLAASNTLTLKQIVDILKAEYPNCRALPKGEIPNFIVRLSVLFDDRFKDSLGDLGTYHQADAAYVSTLTKVIPRPAKEAVLATAQSLIARGKVKL